MGIAWRKKLAVRVKWLVAEPLLLFVLIYNRHLTQVTLLEDNFKNFRGEIIDVEL